MKMSQKQDELNIYRVMKHLSCVPSTQVAIKVLYLYLDGQIFNKHFYCRKLKLIMAMLK